MPQSRFFRVCTAIIMVLIILFLLTRISFLFAPLWSMLTMLLLPLLISGFFYYLFRPFVNYMDKRGIHRLAATLLIYIVVSGLTALLVVGLGPMLSNQVQLFGKNVPELLEGISAQINHWEHNRWASPNAAAGGLNISGKLSEWLNQSITLATNYLTGLFSLMTSTILITSSVPIILFYQLTEGDKATTAFIRTLPYKYQTDAEELLQEMDSILSEFTIGRIVVCLLVGLMLYVGFLSIGLPYPLLLALFAAVMNLIPFIGPIIGAVPCIIVAFTESSWLALWVLLIVLAAKLIDNAFISPQVLSKRMDVHPITVVFLLLVSGETTGILGMLLAIPVYMILKILWLRVRSHIRFIES